MRIYHGCPSAQALKRTRESAPSYVHGAEWNPNKMTPHDVPYILDNGCWSAAHNDEPWDPTPFFDRLDEIEQRMPRDPDFVVLPDVHQDGTASLERSIRYANHVADYGYDYYLPVQDGVSPEDAVTIAQKVGASGLFVGGSRRWKIEWTNAYRVHAHDHGLKCHVGQPISVLWGRGLGVDSIDTTTIVRNKAWAKLTELEQQSLLAG